MFFLTAIKESTFLAGEAISHTTIPKEIFNHKHEAIYSTICLHVLDY